MGIDECTGGVRTGDRESRSEAAAVILLRNDKGLGFPGGPVVENPPASAGDTGSSPGPGRSHMPRSTSVRAPQLLNLRSGACEPQLLSPQATATEACAIGARAPQQERPPQ